RSDYASDRHDRDLHSFPTRRSSDLDPDDVTRVNVIDKYRDWLVAGVGRLREHRKIFKQIGAKPVMFVMCESIQHADRIGEWLREDRKSTRLNSSHVKISYAVFCLKT